MWHSGIDQHKQFCVITTYGPEGPRVDSDTLALLLRADLIPRAHMIAPAQRAPRDLMRTRLRLVEKSVSAQNRIDRLLEKFNLTSVTELEACYQLQASFTIYTEIDERDMIIRD